MEDVSCPLCDANRPLPLFRAQDWQYGLPGKFEIVRCGQCGGIYLSPRPDAREMVRFYPADYAAYARDALREGPGLQRRLRLYGLTKRCRTVAKLAKGGHLLDVGCATGDFIALMRAYGQWSVVGIELDERAASLARERYGLTVVNGSIDAGGPSPGILRCGYALGCIGAPARTSPVTLGASPHGCALGGAWWFVPPTPVACMRAPGAPTGRPRCPTPCRRL